MDWVWVLIAVLRAASPAPDDQWVTRLSALDEVRAEAFATTDAALLDRVYVRGSRAGEADAATLADYRRRGGQVLGADLRVISCRVLSASSSRARLDVVDQLGPARVVWADGSASELPRDEPSRRVITVVRTSEGWRIAGVSPRPSSRR
ncbi:hypothetical protein [Aeromicrobium ginsengisoli]|uniref:SnoaL-like domain-containing protein n=1 Tax=Aeromicrobium ginsengisoli TaxID=363867 RepID=A0A5M4FJ60_9ACTN|nr:hypothetical protein [Aeromicrobium ginsengisoli]KAA1399793.1 hypothetical protein ESP70_003270 [Aeromicrobium ginsengisoli]